MATDSTDEFDWVAAQSNCTAESMFARLRAGVQKDVDRCNTLVDGQSHRFELNDDSDDDGDRFEVSKVTQSGFSTAKTLAFVTFTREGRRIHVAGEGVDVDFTAIVAVNADGLCHFFVGEIEYAEWQVRKLALEHLFFDDEED
jgi:hypothetical protein